MQCALLYTHSCCLNPCSTHTEPLPKLSMQVPPNALAQLHSGRQWRGGELCNALGLCRLRPKMHVACICVPPIAFRTGQANFSACISALHSCVPLFLLSCRKGRIVSFSLGLPPSVSRCHISHSVTEWDAFSCVTDPGL